MKHLYTCTHHAGHTCIIILPSEISVLLHLLGTHPRAPATASNILSQGGGTPDNVWKKQSRELTQTQEMGHQPKDCWLKYSSHYSTSGSFRQLAMKKKPLSGGLQSSWLCPPRLLNIQNLTYQSNGLLGGEMLCRSQYS